MEYFSELTESYFGINDFYPFVKEELKKYDPIGYECVEKIWNFNENTIQNERQKTLQKRNQMATLNNIDIINNNHTIIDIQTQTDILRQSKQKQT